MEHSVFNLNASESAMKKMVKFATEASDYYLSRWHFVLFAQLSQPIGSIAYPNTVSKVLVRTVPTITVGIFSKTPDNAIETVGVVV